MPTDAEARHSAALAEITELGLSLARDIHRRALAAEDDDRAAELASAFHRLTRTVRQSIALEAKLARDARRDAAEIAEADEKARRTRIAVRKARVRETLERVIWDECDPDEAEFLEIELDELIEDAAEQPGFVDDPIETVIAHLRALIGEAAEAPSQAMPPPATHNGHGHPPPPDSS